MARRRSVRSQACRALREFEWLAPTSRAEKAAATRGHRARERAPRDLRTFWARSGGLASSWVAIGPRAPTGKEPANLVAAGYVSAAVVGCSEPLEPASRRFGATQTLGDPLVELCGFVREVLDQA